MARDKVVTWLTTALGLTAGESPFPWQLRLLDNLGAGRLPRALDLPTGLGKTSVMAIWLVARALGAPVPLRLVYVVDRRAVVDQATDVAEGLRQVVENLPDLRLALNLSGPLPISTLRGQHTDNRAWLADPASPAIVIGTVDMVGSRLLFSGYGVSRKMRPYHAGLLGADTLLVLDEAHLVPPFERLLDQIASGVDAHGQALAAADPRERQIVPPLHFMALSATGRQRSANDTFTLSADDRSHAVVRRRLDASKRIRLFEEVDDKDLPDALAAHAWELTAKGRKAARIIVFVDKRDHAQKIHQALRKLAGEIAPVELFVGGRRVHEREKAARRLAELGFIAGSGSAAEQPMFVIATSAGEVGVDLDADHAACDLVAWERMVQRLGRVNRRGAGDASVVVVPCRRDDKDLQARQAAVMAVLRLLPLTADRAIDGSPEALSALKASTDAVAAIESASTPAPLHPPLTRALVDAWAMTSMDQHTGRPEVEPWLRGWPEQQEPPQVSVIWRTHLPVDDRGHVFSGRHLELFLDAAGPHLSERLEIDLPHVVDWLMKRSKSLPDGEPFQADARDGEPALRRSDIVALAVNDSDGRARVLRGADIAAQSSKDLGRWLTGTTLWVDRRIGGLTDGLLDSDANVPADDVTELSDSGQPGPIPFRISRVEAPTVPDPADGWRHEVILPLSRTDEGVGAWLVVSSLLSELAGSEEGRSGARRAQLLDEHQAWAEAAAGTLARTLRLPAPYGDVLVAGAGVHDEGKRADRWQHAFHAPGGGRPPYAKTVGRPDVSLLDGYRHEFGSLPFAEADARIRAMSPDLRELCLHLVAAHHGAARPLIRTDGAAEPPTLAEARARGVALRFAELNVRWGPWGLAWWESLLRAADQQASRRNDGEGTRHG